MPRGRHFRARGFQRSARLTEWQGPPDQGFVAVATTGATLVSSTSVEDPITIMRSRGQFGIQTALNADLAVTGAIGWGIVSSEAFSIGITALPHPWRDADWDGWFIWKSFSLSVEFHDATGVNFPASIMLDVDSKAMRKVGQSNVIVMVAESQAGAYQVVDGIRQLIKLA